MEFMSGWVGGVATLLVGQPMDAVKIRLQGTNLTARPYSGALSCLVGVLRTEGIRGLYRGVLSPMLGCGFATAAQFGVYGMLTQRLAPPHDGEGQRPLRDVLKELPELTLVEKALCATLGGIAYACVIAPFETVRLRLHTQEMFAHRRYYGALHCARRLYAEGGIARLYLGLSGTLMRDIPGSLVYFRTYATLRGIVGDGGERDAPHVLLCGAGAGVAQWVVVMPMDTVKTQLQIAKRHTYMGPIHCARVLYRHEGLRAFYRGIGPALVRAAISNAVCFLGVETSYRVMTNDWE